MFIAYVFQGDAGCDYYRGCLQGLWKLEATTKHDALEELKKLVVGELKDGEYRDGYWDEKMLTGATMFEVSSEEQAPVLGWYKQAADLAKIEMATANELLERAELERLRKKYGGERLKRKT